MTTMTERSMIRTKITLSPKNTRKRNEQTVNRPTAHDDEQRQEHWQHTAGLFRRCNSKWKRCLRDRTGVVWRCEERKSKLIFCYLEYQILMGLFLALSKPILNMQYFLAHSCTHLHRSSLRNLAHIHQHFCCFSWTANFAIFSPKFDVFHITTLMTIYLTRKFEIHDISQRGRCIILRKRVVSKYFFEYESIWDYLLFRLRLKSLLWAQQHNTAGWCWATPRRLEVGDEKKAINGNRDENERREFRKFRFDLVVRCRMLSCR